MSSFSPPLINAEDIQKILKKWESDRQNLKEELEKPVVIFVGDAGTGKSSCIKVLLNITDKKALERLNITGHGKCGTDECFRHESKYLVAIDIKGKLQDQNIDEYVTYVSGILDKEKRMDIIIGVIKACGDREGDIDTLIKSLEIIFEKWEKPFVVLMNKIDQVKILGAEEQFKIRQKYLEEQCDKVRMKLTWKFESHPIHVHGVFPVSAVPIQRLGPECPDRECVKSTREEDDFPDATTKILVKDVAVHCFLCKKIFILKQKPENVDLEKIENYAQKKGVSIIDYEIPPKDLGPRSNLMQAIIFLTHEIVGLALMKSICKTLSDNIAATTKDIRDEAVKIYGKSDAIKVDKSLCGKIAKNFGLEQSALEHSEYEASRWEKVGNLEKFQGYLRYFTNRPNQGLSDYIFAWGIYYARKFHDIAVTINDSFKDDKPYEDIAKQCNEICAQYTEIQQLEYYQFILENSREVAIKKYILDYEKPKTSNAAVGNKPTKYNPAKFGKAQFPS